MIRCTICSHIHNAVGGCCPHCGSPFGQIPVVGDTPLTEQTARKLTEQAAEDQAEAEAQNA